MKQSLEGARVDASLLEDFEDLKNAIQLTLSGGPLDRFKVIYYCPTDRKKSLVRDGGGGLIFFAGVAEYS